MGSVLNAKVWSFYLLHVAELKSGGEGHLFSNIAYRYIIIYNMRRTLPRVRALYDYEAADVDEISIREGDVFELVQEREYLDIYTIST